jgi:hypothetical protein
MPGQTTEKGYETCVNDDLLTKNGCRSYADVEWADGEGHSPAVRGSAHCVGAPVASLPHSGIR